MSRFFGPIGFVETVETEEGSDIWEEVPTERNYRGEIRRNSKRLENGEGLNKNINILNQINPPWRTREPRF